jgi:hypothetical protein
VDIRWQGEYLAARKRVNSGLARANARKSERRPRDFPRKLRKQGVCINKIARKLGRMPMHLKRHMIKAPANRVFIFGTDNGLGDDLMVFWAYLAAVLEGLLPCGCRFFFERAETRRFLGHYSGVFPEINLVEEVGPQDKPVYVRGGYDPDFFPGKPVRNIPYLLFSAPFEVRQYKFHKVHFEYGGKHRIQPRNLLASFARASYSWLPPYPEIYDGWQELGIAFKVSKRWAVSRHARLSRGWPVIRGRLVGPADGTHTSGRPLLFPAGGASQDFHEPFLDWMRKFCKFDIVRFKDDKRPADIYFSSLEEAVSLMRSASCVITTDSACSHAAQFFAAKHILICSRSRPRNVCFLGAANTWVLDLGSALRCRPCVYVEHTKPVCAAGFVRCKALVEMNREKENRLKEAFVWAGLSNNI